LRSLPHQPAHVWWQFAGFALVVSYLLSLIFVRRPASGYLTHWDGWVANLALIVAIVPVWLRVRHTSRMQFAWAAIALGLALNSIANLVYLFRDQNIHPTPSPGLSDFASLL
jgi:hypothetical protein